MSVKAFDFQSLVPLLYQPKITSEREYDVWQLKSNIRMYHISSHFVQENLENIPVIMVSTPETGAVE